HRGRPRSLERRSRSPGQPPRAGRAQRGPAHRPGYAGEGSMKASMRRWVLCAAALAGTAGMPLVVSADGPPISAEAARALANIESDRGKRTAEDRRAAERLTVEGDRAYRKQDYDAAYRA